MPKNKEKESAPPLTETLSHGGNIPVVKHTPRGPKSQAKDDRTRNWTFVVYPVEGNPPAPENWREIIDQEHIQWVESPLHDKDLNPSGEPKRPHIHVLVLYEGNKSFEQVKALTEALRAPIPQKCASTKGLVRYMAHLDNPEKAQYDKAEIIGHGGVDVAEYLKPTSSTRYQLIADMREWVDNNQCMEFCDLFAYAASEHFDDWFPLLCDNSAYIMGEYIKSCRNKGTRPNSLIRINPKTGEVFEEKLKVKGF